MKKISLLMLIMLLAVSASGGYGYYEYVYNADEEEEASDDEPVSSSGSKPIARITPSNPKIQINETISFSGSDSTDSDNDALTYQDSL